MTTHQRSGWFSGRTKLVTIASIIAVGVAGATAVGANIGILNAVDSSNTGTLSAAGDLTPPETKVVDVYVDGESTTTVAGETPASALDAQEFAVDAAGTLSVAATDNGIRLDTVSPTTGWTWTLVQPSPTDLTVTFTNGVRTLEFVASAAADGTIAAGVNEPMVIPAPAPAGGYSDDHDQEYEGADDDD